MIAMWTGTVMRVVKQIMTQRNASTLSLFLVTTANALAIKQNSVACITDVSAKAASEQMMLKIYNVVMVHGTPILIYVI